MTAIKRIHHVFGRMGLIWFNYLYPKKLPHWKTNVQTKNHHAKVQALQGPSHLKIALLQHPPPTHLALSHCNSSSSTVGFGTAGPAVSTTTGGPAVETTGSGGVRRRWKRKVGPQGHPMTWQKMGDKTSWRNTIPRILAHLVRWWITLSNVRWLDF